MKLKLLFLSLLVGISTIKSQNIQMRSNLPYSPNALANIASYADALGNEYALVGTDFGVSIVDVTDPTTPVIKFTVNGPSSQWREIKTYRTWAYVTTEGGGGLQIIDLSNLPASVSTSIYSGDGAIANQLGSIHALHCDTATGFLYLYGSDIGFGNTLFIDLNTNPGNPTYAGQYVYPGTQSDKYVHDGFVENDTMYEAHINSGFVAIVDVRNKNAPILLATQTTPTNFTHNTWLSDDHKTLFTTDENSGSYLGAYDISNLSNIRELSRFQTAPGSGAIIHNTQILNNYAITSWYKEGVVITDVSRPDNPIEVGHYDTYPQGSGNGFNGCWGVDPYLPSGTIVASDIDNGLFVLTPTYIRGCYLEGNVTDSVTGNIISGALIEILSTTITKSSDNSGDYKTGLATAGTYDVRFSKSGYYSKTITGVVMANGIVAALNVQLVPFQTFAFTGSVVDSLTGLPVANADVVIASSNGLVYKTQADLSGNISFSAVVPDDYIVYAGKWGYRTSCQLQSVIQGTLIVAQIAQGYYDDFSFNNGWSVSGTSANSWERGEPTGTYDGNNTEINPQFDVAGDCGDSCFVTDNGGAPYNSSDVDNGNTILTSPIFDATIYQSPTISYYRRYLCINGTGTPNDTMKVSLSNGTTTVRIENIPPNDPTNGTWVQHSVLAGTLLPVTSTMRLIVEVSDNAPGNIVEGALDKFEVTGNLINSVPQNSVVQSFSTYPNPFDNNITISYQLGLYSGSVKLIISDVLGQVVFQKEQMGSKDELQFGSQLKPGIYFVQITNGQQTITRKIVKK